MVCRMVVGVEVLLSGLAPGVDAALRSGVVVFAAAAGVVAEAAEAAATAVVAGAAAVVGAAAVDVLLAV